MPALPRRYVGDGAWIPGIPARDLDPDEVSAALKIEPDLDKSGLYAIVHPPAARDREREPGPAPARGED